MRKSDCPDPDLPAFRPEPQQNLKGASGLISDPELVLALVFTFPFKEVTSVLGR